MEIMQKLLYQSITLSLGAVEQIFEPFVGGDSITFLLIQAMLVPLNVCLCTLYSRISC